MKTSGLLSSLFLMIALTSACGSSESGGDGTGGANTGGSTGGNGTGGTITGGKSGSGGTGAIDPGGPLLDRPSGDRYHCSVSRPVARLNMPWGGFSLAPGSAGPELAFVQADRNNPDPNRTGNSIEWSTLSADGKLGSRAVLRMPTNQYLAGVGLTGGDSKSTVVWTESEGTGNTYSLNSVQVNGAGNVVTQASVLTSLSRSTLPKLARVGSGYALLWSGGDYSAAKLSFGLLDESGKLATTPVVLAQGEYLEQGTVAAFGDRFVVSYTDRSASGLVSRLLFLDSKGSALGQPITLESGARAGVFSSTTPSLLVRGEQVFVAWTVDSGDSDVEAMDAATTIRIARFDADGVRQGLMYDLQAPVRDRESVQPSWIEIGDDVGLIWSDGSIIYFCAGCVPNHSLKFVVLDGETLTPQSEVVALMNTLPSGGLLIPAVAHAGDDLVVVSSVTYHTSAEGASGTIRCTP